MNKCKCYLDRILLMFSASFSCNDLSPKIFSLAFWIIICWRHRHSQTLQGWIHIEEDKTHPMKCIHQLRLNVLQGNSLSLPLHSGALLPGYWWPCWLCRRPCWICQPRSIHRPSSWESPWGKLDHNQESIHRLDINRFSMSSVLVKRTFDCLWGTARGYNES